ncbi:hypothetical protein OTU49_015294, partial [Cherax quadricarinatus]
CMQAALLVLFNLVSALVVFPAVMSLDLRRRHAGRADLLCCFQGSEKEQVVPLQHQVSPAAAEEGRSRVRHSRSCVAERTRKVTVTRALPPPGGGTVTHVVPPTAPRECWGAPPGPHAPSAPSLESLSTANSTRDLVGGGKKCSGLSRAWRSTVKFWSGWSIGELVATVYGPALTHGAVKAATIVGLIVSVAAAAWGVSRVEDGLDLTDIVPSHTPEYAFLSAQQRYFGFYNMFAVTQGNLEYPTKQRLLHEYYEAFTSVNNIIKNDDGGLPEFWLSLFRDWLVGLQAAFERDWRDGCITQETWNNNASDEGVLAYKLLVQTGRVDNPIDRSLVTQ